MTNAVKLSKAQEKVMEKAYEKINRARECKDYEEYVMKKTSFSEAGKLEEIKERRYEEYYKMELEGIVLIQCNSKTLRKLEELGLVKILYDSTGSHFGIDTVKVLNY